MTEPAVAENPITQDISSVISDSFTPDTTDSFVPDEPIQGQSAMANLLNVGMDVIKDIPGQIQDLMTIPSKLLGLPSPDFKSKLSTESVPYLMEKGNTPIGTIPIPTLSYNDFNNIVHGKFTYTINEISPTPIDIGYYAVLGGVLAKNQLATARWNHQLNKLIKTEEVRGAVMNNIESFDNLMTQVGIKLPTEMSLEAKTEFVLNQAKTSPKLGTAIMDLVKGKIVAQPPTSVQPIIPTTGQTVAPQVGELPKPVLVAPEVPIVAPKESQGGTIAPQITPTTIEKPVEGKLPIIQGEGKTQVRGLAKGVEAKAIENKLTDTFGALPEYQAVNMKEQSTKAQDLLTTDPERAKRIAMGEELAPEGMLPESLFVAVENKAVKEADVETLRRLATSSGLTTEATTMGQRLRTLAERDPESPVSAINEVVKAREQAGQRKLKTKETKKLVKSEVSSIKEHIKKVAPTKEDWGSFIRSIQC